MGSKGKNGSSTIEAPSKDGTSLFNVIMLYLSLLGLGVIGGYGAFFLMFNQRCLFLLESAEETYNTSKIEWQSKHQEAIAEKNECLNPLQQLQGKLEEQSILAEKHQTLIKEHTVTLSKLATLQQAKEESVASRAKVQAQIEEIQRELKQANQRAVDAVKDKEQVEKNLQTRLQIAQDELAQKTADFKSLQEKQEECSSSNDSSLESDLKTVTTFVQNRAERMCRME